MVHMLGVSRPPVGRQVISVARLQSALRAFYIPRDQNARALHVARAIHKFAMRASLCFVLNSVIDDCAYRRLLSLRNATSPYSYVSRKGQLRHS